MSEWERGVSSRLQSFVFANVDSSFGHIQEPFVELIRQNLHTRCGSIPADFLVCCRHRPCGCFTNEVEPDNGYHYEKNSSESDYGAEDTDAHDRLP